MIDILAIATALLNRSALDLRQLVQDALRDSARLTDIAMPATASAVELAAAASMVELLCIRAGVRAPDWAGSIPPLAVPMHVTRGAETMPRLRALCEAESPEPLRKRGFFAPPDFLTFA